MVLHPSDAGGASEQSTRHLFERGEGLVADARGNHWPACRLCGRDRRAHPRRSHKTGAPPSVIPPKVAARSRSHLTVVTRTSVHDLPAPSSAAPDRRRDEWQLHLLDHAMDQALRVDLAPLTRTLLLDAQRAVRSELRPTTVRHTPVPDLADPPPRRDPIQPKPVPADQHSAARRKLAAGFRSDKTRALFLRACEQGWQPAITGTGHAKLISPDGKALVLSLTNTGGRGFGNAKATAKRMGLDVSGL